MHGQSRLPPALNQEGTALVGAESRELQGGPKPRELMETPTQRASPAAWSAAPTKAIGTRLAEAS